MAQLIRRQAAKAALKEGDIVTLHRSCQKRFIVDRIEAHAITLSDAYDETYYCELWEVNEVQPNS